MRPLQVGERVRLTPNGPVCLVVRVTQCAAYVQRKVHREFEATDWKTGAKRMVSTETSHVEPISLHAFVYREED